MKLRSFEDLEAWKESRKLRKMVSEFTQKSYVTKDFVFCNQFRSAALSVMSNIAEGFECLTDKESISFLGFARRSCGEVRSQLYSALDDNYLNRNDFDKIYEQVSLTGRLISGFIAYLKKKTYSHRPPQP